MVEGELQSGNKAWVDLVEPRGGHFETASAEASAGAC